MAAMLVYVTTASREEALNIGRMVVGERLAAAAHILDGMTSVYWWEQRVQEAGEATLILMTTSQLVGQLTDRIMELHSYTCPCVVAMPIAYGNPHYLAWIDKETAAVCG